MVDHNPPPTTKPGLEGMKEMFHMFFNAFPDIHIEVEDLIAEGDTVVMRATTTGTHQGDFMGIPATGKRFPTVKSTWSKSLAGNSLSIGASKTR